jgi:cytochrome c oxidase subunit IV
MADTDNETFHPGPTEYIQIGIILAVLTALEVALYFMDLARPITIPSLLVLTAMKFLLVVFWFMHLRFDSPLFRRLFFMGIVLALVLYAIVAATFYLGSA